MRFNWKYWYIGPNGMPTLNRTKRRAKCLSFAWGTKETVLLVHNVEALCCDEGACSKCYIGPVVHL